MYKRKIMIFSFELSLSSGLILDLESNLFRFRRDKPSKKVRFMIPPQRQINHFASATQWALPGLTK